MKNLEMAGLDIYGLMLLQFFLAGIHLNISYISLF